MTPAAFMAKPQNGAWIGEHRAPALAVQTQLITVPGVIAQAVEAFAAHPSLLPAASRFVKQFVPLLFSIGD